MNDPDLFSWHIYAPLHLVDDYLKCGWLPLGSIHGTHHGVFAVHMKWLCSCPVPNPKNVSTYLAATSASDSASTHSTA